MEIPFEYREAINTYAPITFEGIKLYPIKVKEYEDFLVARSAISFVQQALPVRYLSMPLLSAYYAIEVSGIESGEESQGHFAKALLFLSLALRIHEEKSMRQKVQEMSRRILVSKTDPSALKEIVIVQDGVEKRITPILFQRMRPILAAQNGIELESEDANPELIEAERDIAEANGPKMNYDIATLITSMATFDKKEESDIIEWPILKLERRRRAYQRLFDYLLFGFATINGAKFKGGNPVPSAFFDREEQESTALVDMTSVVGANAVNIGETKPQEI